jgi:hypothetical protein
VFTKDNPEVARYEALQKAYDEGCDESNIKKVPFIRSIEQHEAMMWASPTRHPGSARMIRAYDNGDL